MDKRERVARAIKAAFAEHTEIASLTTEVATKMADAAISALEPVTVQEAARVLLDIVKCRAWSHYPIEMPLTKSGAGPAKLGVDADRMSYEVWEAETYRTISDHTTLPNAIEAWLLALAQKDA
jgi:hypothetical protein